jgi:biopolymer transport protein ExbD
MAFNRFRGNGHAQPMAEINMIPLIDVMLVLLVIFIVTAPLLTHAVKIDLPKVSSQANLTPPATIQLAIGADGSFHWNGELEDRGGLTARMAAAGRMVQSPELHLRVDRRAQYELVAEVMAIASRAGITRIGFVSEPNARGNAGP